MLARKPVVRPSRKLAVAAVMGMAISFGAAACGNGDRGAAPDWFLRYNGPDWFPRYSGEVNGDDALLDGTLEVQGRCLYVTAGPGQRTLPIFPRDSSFSPATGRLVVLGKTFHVGQQFRSGGSGDGPEYMNLMNLITQPDPSCSTTHVWIVGAVD